jgi:hypothetical protein
MIHLLSSRSFCWIATHSSRDGAASPGCQKTLSSSVTRRPVTSPSCRASVDLPEAPGPRIKTRFTPEGLARCHVSGRPGSVVGAEREISSKTDDHRRETKARAAPISTVLRRVASVDFTVSGINRFNCWAMAGLSPRLACHVSQSAALARIHRASSSALRSGRHGSFRRPYSALASP